MGVNKVEYGDKTLIDLTGDTVTPESLKKGFTAHDKTGELITGTFENTPPDGYIDTSGATAGAYDIYDGKTAYVNGELVTGKYVSKKYNFTQTTVPEGCSWSTTAVSLSCDFEPSCVAIVLNSANYTNNRVIAVWAMGTSAIVYHTKTSSGVARTQVTSNVSSYWYYDSVNKKVVINSPSTTYLWSIYAYRFFLFK